MSLALAAPAARSRTTLRLPLWAGLVAVLAVAHLMTGPRPLPLAELSRLACTPPPVPDFDQFVLCQLRLPRTLGVMACGAALAAAGLVLQCLLRNRLAEPHLLGLNAGASLALVLGTLAGGVPAGLPSVALASLGAAAAFLLVLLLSRLARQGDDGTALIFAGIAVSALAGAVVSAVLILDQDTLDQLRFWLMGDAAGLSVAALRPAAATMALGLALAIAALPGLRLIGLGAGVAAGLGLSRPRVAGLAIAASACLAGASVALVGPVGFVGLIAPGLVPGAHARLGLARFATVCLAGAALLLLADLVAMRALAPRELPTGALTGLAGAPVFLWLRAQRRK